MKKLVNLYETKEDDASRSAVALTLKAVAKAKIEHIKDNEETLVPVVFLAMHASKEDGQNIFCYFIDLINLVSAKSKAWTTMTANSTLK